MRARSVLRSTVAARPWLPCSCVLRSRRRSRCGLGHSSVGEHLGRRWVEPLRRERVSESSRSRAVRQPGAAHACPRRAADLYVVEQSGTGHSHSSGKTNGVPRRPEHVDLRRRAGSSRACVPSRSTPAIASSTSLHVGQRAQHRGPVPLGRREGSAIESEVPARPFPVRSGTTTAGIWCSGRTATCTRSIGDGGSGGDPEDRVAGHAARSSASCWRSTSRSRVRDGRSRARVEEPLAFHLRPSDWRPLHRRRRSGSSVKKWTSRHGESPGLENYGWNLYEGSQRYEEGRGRTGRARVSVLEYGPRRGPAAWSVGTSTAGRRVPAERGRYVFGDYCSGIVWSFRVARGRGYRRAQGAVSHRAA